VGDRARKTPEKDRVCRRQRETDDREKEDLGDSGRHRRQRGTEYLYVGDRDRQTTERDRVCRRQRETGDRERQSI
jgi:hypothetical protein